MYRPANLEDIKDMMPGLRGSPRPTTAMAIDFTIRATTCENEDGAIQALLPLLLPIIEKFWSSPTVDSRS